MEPGAPDERFETPHDAALVRVPVRGGDVVVRRARTPDDAP